jgi:CBS domain containing-hemolysin-like protein
VALDLAARPPLHAALLALLAGAIVVSVAEGGARALGFSFSGRVVLRFAPVVRALDVALGPVSLLGARFDASLNRLLPPARGDEQGREASAEQFRQVVANEADVSRAEEAIIHGVFSLGDTEVQEVMVPRVDIVGMASDMPWSEVVDRVRSSEHARFPVYEETIDDVVGILYAKDLLKPVIDDEPPADGWLGLVRAASFIPATKNIDAQLRDFKASRAHIAIVVDEYGGTAGLVTIEDVLEEIVGDIRDEYDVEEPEIEQARDGRRYWVSGRLTLDELSEVLDHDFARDDVSTVGGLVYELLGRVPKAGEEITLDGYRIVVERVRRRRVERVYFERTAALAGRPSS